MKHLNSVLLAAVIATVMGLASQANAQYRNNEDDGIAASPKVRQMLNERNASARAATTGIAASPRVRQTMNERRPSTTSPTASGELVSTGYRATGKDGVTASPRLRQQISERPTEILVAPVK